MNPKSRKEAEELARGSDIEGLVICPPFVFLDDASRMMTRSKLGAQDVFWEELGAYTGEVSAAELKDLCVEYVIIGHSERRQNLGETDEMVARKVKAAIEAGITPILCVGETRAEHDSGQTEIVVKRELEKGLSSIINHQSSISDHRLSIIVAYEPIWAIGTGVPDTPENMLKMVQLMRKIAGGSKMDVRIIYGGSVNSKNAEEFLKHREIDGALVGGSSLKPEEIKKIVEIAGKYK